MDNVQTVRNISDKKKALILIIWAKPIKTIYPS